MTLPIDEQETCGCGMRFPPEGTCGMCGQSAKSGAAKSDEELLAQISAHPDRAVAWAMALEFISRRDVDYPDKYYGFRVPEVPALDPFLLREKPKPDIDQINMTAKVEGDDLVIRLPLDLLVHSQLHREESMTITDPQAMAAYMAKYILDWGGDAERGSTAFEDFLDAFFMDALESAETWISGWWESDDES
jgi:hypothetical protein